MKILMASHYFASHKGGIEIVADALYQEFTKHQIEVVWLAADPTPSPEPVGKSRAAPIPVSNSLEEKIGLPFPIPVKNGIKTIVREVRQTDVLVLHDCLYLSNVLAFLAARLYGKPIITIQHTRFFPSRTFLQNVIIRLATRFLTRPMLSYSSQVVFISETVRKYFSRIHFRVPPEVIFNGVDTELFQVRPETELISTIRREYGLDEQLTTILFVGRFIGLKGVSVLRKVAALRPNWTFVFAGWGPLDPTRWNAPNVRVFSHLRGPSMAALYRACDLLVLPSVGEGFPLVIQEALASGLPVVCGDETLRSDPALEMFVKGAPVFLGDDERTAAGFLAAIEESLASKAESAQSRRDFAVRRYSWDRAVQQYLDIISRLLPRVPISLEKSPAGTEHS
jgi:glycosyltransferase involved in cell wall biosynthesis